MAGLADFRKQHPEYNDMGDKELSDALYNKFYSDMPRAEFDSKMGAAPAPPVRKVEGQPSVIDRAVASPIGRFIQSNVISPALNIGGRAAMTAIGVHGINPLQPVANYEQSKYQDAVDRNKNVPGYAAARSEAQRIADTGPGYGLTGKMFPTLTPTMAGLTGLAGGLNMSNAMADIEAEKQQQFMQDHPILSTGAQAVGGLMLPPTAMAGKGASLPKPQPRIPVTPESQALARVQPLMAQSKAVPDVIALRGAMGQTTKPLTTAEIIGKPAEVMLGALARREGATADELAGLMAGRKEAAAGRILDDFAQSSGIMPEAAMGDIQSVAEKGRLAASPAYDRAYAQPATMTDRLAQFAQEDIIKRGMQDGIKIERLKALAEGRPFDPQAYAVTGFNGAGDPIISGVPTWRSWDAAKTGLDDMLNAYRDKTTGRLVLDKKGQAIEGVRKSLLKELDAANPAYGEARSIASDYLSAQDAFDRGGKAILNDNMPAKQFADVFANLKGANQEAFKGGIANKLFNLAQSDRLNLKRFITPVVRAKLETALGRDNAARFIQNLQSESGMANFARTQAPGAGSGTAPWAEAMNQMDAGTGSAAMDFAEKVARRRGDVKGAALDSIFTKGADALAAYRTRGLPIPVRDQMGQMLMYPETLAKALENAPQVKPAPRGLLAPPQLPYGLLFGVAPKQQYGG